jgi:hypothetical protein
MLHTQKGASHSEQRGIKKEEIGRCHSSIHWTPISYVYIFYRREEVEGFSCIIASRTQRRECEDRRCVEDEVGMVVEVFVYLVASFKKVIRSFRSLAFLRPAKAILVPGMYFLGFSR